MTTIASRGSVTLTSLRLCSRAPETTILSTGEGVITAPFQSRGANRRSGSPRPLFPRNPRGGHGLTSYGGQMPHRERSWGGGARPPRHGRGERLVRLQRRQRRKFVHGG